MKGKLPLFLILSGAVAALLSAFVILYFNMIGVEPAFFKAFYTDLVPHRAIVPLLLLSLLGGGILLRKSGENASKFARALLPAWLLFLLLIPPQSFLHVALFIFLTMIVVWRIGLVCNGNFPAWRRGPTLVLLFAGTLIGIGWGIFMQIESFNRLWFTFTDWTEYYTGYLRLTESWNKPILFCYNAGHFNPFPNLLITPVIALFPFPQTLFVLNSLFIYSTIPLWYLLARSLGMRRCPAVLSALLLMCHFTIPNLNLSLFYGFHPIILFPALLLAFYYFYRKGNRTGYVLFFLLILFLQETTAVFWFGWGLYLILKRKYLQGAALAAFSCAWFAFAVKVVSPVVKKMLYNTPDSWNSNYVQTFHYAELGNSISGILLAPLTKPLLFFEKLFNPMNFYFCAVVLLAFFPLALAAPRLLIVSLPLLAGIFLMGGADALNISMWYQTEIFAILILSCAAGYAQFRRNGCRCLEPLAYGLPPRSRRRKAFASLCAVMIGMLLCGLFFGRLPVGKYSFRRIQERPDCSALIERIQSIIPPSVRVLTTPQMQMHFLRRSSNLLKAKEPFRSTYILTYLDDLHVDFEKNRALYERMKKNPAYEPVLVHEERGLNLILYRRIASQRPSSQK